MAQGKRAAGSTGSNRGFAATDVMCGESLAIGIHEKNWMQTNPDAGLPAAAEEAKCSSR
jgi:hypothetical protein